MSTKLKLIVAGETAYDRGIFCVGISDSPQDAFDKLKAAFSWCECYWVALGRPDPPVSDGKWITFDIDGLTQKRVNEAWIELSKQASTPQPHPATVARQWGRVEVIEDYITVKKTIVEKWKRFYHQYIGENKSPLADMHEAIDARLREIGVKPHETLTLRSKRNRSGHYTYFDVFHDGKYIFSFDDSEKGFYTDEEEPSIQ